MKKVFFILLLLYSTHSLAQSSNGINWDRYYITGSLRLGAFNRNMYSEPSAILSIGKDSMYTANLFFNPFIKDSVLIPKNGDYGFDLYTSRLVFRNGTWKTIAYLDDSVTLLLTKYSAAVSYVSLSGSYTNPSWLISIPFTKITATPNTLAGYGISDAYTKTASDARYIQSITLNTPNTIYSTPINFSITSGAATGTLTLNSQSANSFLAAPNGSSGAPSFRAIVNADLPLIPVTSGISGIVPIANGGTNSTATPTNGGIVYGTGTAHAISAAGTSGYFLISGGAGSPTWQAITASGNEITFSSGVIGKNKTEQTLTDGATVTFNVASGYNAKLTIGGNRTLTFSNAIAGEYYTLKVIQDATGSRTLTPSFTWRIKGGGGNQSGALPMTTNATATDIYTFYYDGTTYWLNYGLNF